MKIVSLTIARIKLARDIFRERDSRKYGMEEGGRGGEEKGKGEEGKVKSRFSFIFDQL